jgi:hypothetical protein
MIQVKYKELGQYSAGKKKACLFGPLAENGKSNWEDDQNDTWYRPKLDKHVSRLPKM